MWCLGDVVGYGPDPGPCIEMLAEQELVCVVGNHDYAALGRMGVETFNSYAAGAALWTREQLESDHVAFLEGLPKVTSSGEFCAGPRQPARPDFGSTWSSGPSALENFRRMNTPFCLVGHSHLPFVCLEDGGNASLQRVEGWAGSDAGFQSDYRQSGQRGTTEGRRPHGPATCSTTMKSGDGWLTITGWPTTFPSPKNGCGEWGCIRI